VNFSRQVSWKRQDLAIKACIKTGKKLTIIGDGPEHKNLVKAANGSELITFKEFMTADEIAKELAHSEGFIFPSMEPFGIAPVEALSAGCPVIAFAQGGAVDYIKDGINGMLFEHQTVDSLEKALKKFDSSKYDRKEIIKSAQEFDVKNFKKKLQKYIDEKVAK
jgi:glycosyltransferase involved in cell wall biosynthesis